MILNESEGTPTAVVHNEGRAEREFAQSEYNSSPSHAKKLHCPDCGKDRATLVVALILSKGQVRYRTGNPLFCEIVAFRPLSRNFRFTSTNT